MKILISGLGLIGGSMARGFSFFTKHEVDGFDPDPEACRLAKIAGACRETYTKLPELYEYDMIIPAAFPMANLELLTSGKIPAGKIVVDLGGIKRRICEVGFEAARKGGFTFIGGHPMAGTQFSGFAASRENLFSGATMLLVPPDDVDTEILERVKALFLEVGFGRVKLTDAATHDRIIAFTSQLPHIVSAAYAKSPTAKEHEGFSAGSFRDLTRVAKLNEGMWSELFLEDRDYLVPEIERMAKTMLAMADALKAGEIDRLIEELRIEL